MHKPAFAQQAHELRRHQHVGEAARAERRDREPDGGEAHVEALVQVGADEGESAPEGAALQRHHRTTVITQRRRSTAIIWPIIEPW